MSKQKDNWIYTPDDWRYCQINSTSFRLHGKLGRAGIEGGIEYPTGSFLVQSPAREFATGLFASEFSDFLADHRTKL